MRVKLWKVNPAKFQSRDALRNDLRAKEHPYLGEGVLHYVQLGGTSVSGSVSSGEVKDVVMSDKAQIEARIYNEKQKRNQS